MQTDYDRSAVGGRQLFTRTIASAVYNQDQFKPKSLKLHPSNGSFSILSLLGFIDGLTPLFILKLLRIIRSHQVFSVIVNGSNYGLLVFFIKIFCPKTNVLVIYHNCEFQFFIRLFKSTPSLKSAAVALVSFLTEFLSTHFSTARVCLSSHDAQALKTFYLKHTTHIIPVAISISDSSLSLCITPTLPSQFCLFVGTAFYANTKAILHYLKNIHPNVNLPLVIVGKGFSRFNEYTMLNDNVQIFDGPESLADFYRRATVVIDPSFSASGMKTKVAEALAYGKPVIASAAAAAGYEHIPAPPLYVADNDSNFAAYVNKLSSIDTSSVTNLSISLFLRHHSVSAYSRHLKLALGDMR